MSSQACTNQAFSWGEDRVLGLQFHLELELEDVRRFIAAGLPAPQRTVQGAEEMLREPARFAQNRRLMHSLLDRMDAP